MGVGNFFGLMPESVQCGKRDKREIFRAAADAQKIVDMVLGFHPDFAAQAQPQPDRPHGSTDQPEQRPPLDVVPNAPEGHLSMISPPPDCW